MKNLGVHVYDSQRVEDALLIYPPLTKGRGGGVLEEGNKIKAIRFKIIVKLL